MIDYVQPDFYRFNQDSLDLIRFILNRIPNAGSILDVGAGNGIIGIELSRNLNPRMLSLLEIQSEFEPYIQKNISLFLAEPTQTQTQTQIHISSLGQWQNVHHFDLIVCNPPYYLPGHGQESTDQRRNLCRSFKSDSWEILFQRILDWLAPEGKAFIVIKNDPVILKKQESLVFLEISHGIEYKLRP
jgi:tRNA1(Val) A37 N6-methylase TrmN6